MANPTLYNPSFSFSGYQTTSPTRPLPGPRVDTEYNNIAHSLNGTIDALADVRRDDGSLQNGVVTPESLAPGMAYGVTPPVAWATGTTYSPPQAVWQGYILYQCILQHISTTFAADLAAGFWLEVLDFQVPVDIATGAAAAAAADAASAAADAAAAAADAASAEEDADRAEAAVIDVGAAEEAADRAEAAALRAEAAAGAAIGCSTTDSPPASPVNGQLWWRSNAGGLSVWYVDPGGAPGQWVQIA